MADISSEKILLSKLASVSKSWRAYKILKDDYILLKMRNQKSVASTHIDKIDSALAALKALLLQIISLKPLPDMNASLLSVTYMKKSQCIQSLLCDLSKIQNLLDDKTFLSNIKKRLKERQNRSDFQQSREETGVFICCANDQNLTWEKVNPKFQNHHKTIKY